MIFKNKSTTYIVNKNQVLYNKWLMLTINWKKKFDCLIFCKSEERKHLKIIKNKKR